MEEEIEFILDTAVALPRPPADARRHPQRLRRHPAAGQGLRGGEHRRPVARAHDPGCRSPVCSRIAGGKWTTYRKMAEDCVDHAATLAKLDERPCVTKTLRIHGYHPHAEQFGEPELLRLGRGRASAS